MASDNELSPLGVEIFDSSDLRQHLGEAGFYASTPETVPDITMPEPHTPSADRKAWRHAAAIEHRATLAEYVGPDVEQRLHQLAEQVAAQIAEHLKE